MTRSQAFVGALIIATAGTASVHAAGPPSETPRAIHRDHTGADATEPAGTNTMTHAPAPAPSDSTAGRALLDSQYDPTLVHQLDGVASWYGGKFQGRLTANGETFDTNELTAAHRTLPFDTIVRVQSETTGLAVVVRINDRGPFVDNRVIDLSRAAADIIGMTAAGVAPVHLHILHYQRETDLRTLQLGSYAQLENAQRIVGDLVAAGVPAAIETVADLGVHRVIVQGIREAAIPEETARLEALGFRQVLVRRK